MDKSLSDSDIYNALKGKCKIIDYPKVSKYKTIDQLLSPYGCAVILFLRAPNFGHWTCVFKVKNKVEFFDSYGYYPDDELKLIDPEFNENNYQNHTYLLKLMDNSPYELEYNDHKLQQFGDGINTCGRHVINRLRYQKIPIDDYARILKSTDYSPDELVTMMTYNI